LTMKIPRPPLNSVHPVTDDFTLLSVKASSRVIFCTFLLYQSDSPGTEWPREDLFDNMCNSFDYLLTVEKHELDQRDH